jgi:predicted amidophosphoribosyltransferase
VVVEVASRQPSQPAPHCSECGRVADLLDGICARCLEAREADARRARAQAIIDAARPKSAEQPRSSWPFTEPTR